MKFELVTGRTDLVKTFVLLLFLLSYAAGTSPFDENARSYFLIVEEIDYVKAVTIRHDKESGRLQSSGQVIAIGG